MKLAGWGLVGTFISGVLICLGLTPAAMLMLFATATFGPMMHLLDYGDFYSDDDEDDDGWGNLHHKPNPDEPWWPSGVAPDDELIGV